MRAGVVVTAHPGVEDLALQAEELGLHSFWVYDIPVVHGDPFVALSLCAKATRRIRLGIGVTSPALRSTPAAASGLASLNALAPGRIICGVGTGNTARRTLSMRPTTAATLETFTAALQDLCAGRSTEYRFDEDEDPQGDAARDATGHLVLSLLAFAADTAADTPAFADQLGPMGIRRGYSACRVSRANRRVALVPRMMTSGVAMTWCAPDSVRRRWPDSRGSWHCHAVAGHRARIRPRWATRPLCAEDAAYLADRARATAAVR
jgi:hypothetical protein